MKVYSNLIKKKEKKEKMKKKSAAWACGVWIASPSSPSPSHSRLAQPAAGRAPSPTTPVRGHLPMHPAAYCWSYIPGKCSPNTGVPPPTQTPFMRGRLYVGCYITENTLARIALALARLVVVPHWERQTERAKDCCCLQRTALMARLHSGDPWENAVVPTPSSRDTGSGILPWGKTR